MKLASYRPKVFRESRLIAGFPDEESRHLYDELDVGFWTFVAANYKGREYELVLYGAEKVRGFQRAFQEESVLVLPPLQPHSWHTAYYEVDRAIGTYSFDVGSGLLSGIYTLVVLIPSLAVLVRRLHDIGRTGWWVFIGLIPLIGTIVLLVFAATDSQPGSNGYGSNPKTATV